MDLPAELFELFCYVHYVKLAESQVAVLDVDFKVLIRVSKGS